MRAPCSTPSSAAASGSGGARSTRRSSPHCSWSAAWPMRLGARPWPSRRRGGRAAPGLIADGAALAALAEGAGDDRGVDGDAEAVEVVAPTDGGGEAPVGAG